MPKHCWDVVNVDLVGPLPSGHYLLTEVEILSSTSVPTVLPKLDKIFATHGLPKILVSDNGPPFSGTDFGTYLKVNDISHKPIPPKWPGANGLVETFNKPLLRAIRTAHTEGRNWRRELYNFLSNYRATPHTTTGLPPAELLFHRKIRIKLPHYSPTLDTHAMGILLVRMI